MATTPVFKMVPPWTPELLPSVQYDIKGFLKRRSIPMVLELGSGWSTVWFHKMQDMILHSFEHDRGWREEVKRVVGDNVRVWLSDSESMHLYVSNLEDKYDLVLIDCVDEARLPSLFACLTKVAADGWIVLDDSHWEMFKYVPEVMAQMGYGFRPYSGQHTRKTGEVCYHRTHIFSKEFK